MGATEEPILSRLDRLDNILRHLEDMRGGNRTPKSSCASAPSSGTLTSDGQASSVDFFSPKSLEMHCRPIDDVIMEIEHKGNLIERLVHLEDRVLKFEEERLEGDKQRDKGQLSQTPDKNPKKKGLRQLMKSCVKGQGKLKTKD